MRLNHLETVFVRAGLQYAPGDPTGDAVEMGFAVGDDAEAQPTTWYAAAWEDSTALVDGVDTYVARLLVGPSGGAVALEAGTVYTRWLNIAAAPENPVRPVPGPLVVY